MKSIAVSAAAFSLIALVAAQNAFGAEALTAVPAGAVTVTDWYKQNVYDPKDTKIGDIKDVLVDKSGGKISALIVAVGGFLGAGEKDVAVPFEAVKATKKDHKWYLVMDTTKDAMKSAPGYQYDKSTTSWVPEKK